MTTSFSSVFLASSSLLTPPLSTKSNFLLFPITLFPFPPAMNRSPLIEASPKAVRRGLSAGVEAGVGEYVRRGVGGIDGGGAVHILEQIAWSVDPHLK